MNYRYAAEDPVTCSGEEVTLVQPMSSTINLSILLIKSDGKKVKQAMTRKVALEIIRIEFAKYGKPTRASKERMSRIAYPQMLIEKQCNLD